MSGSTVEAARLKYRPGSIRYLLVAEAPPPTESGRFFYFEDVREHDGLFIQTMRVLYGTESTSAKAMRREKRRLLERFMADRFYLIDACETPIAKTGRLGKIRQIEASLPGLCRRLQSLVQPGTAVVLITNTVYEACADALRADGFRVINRGPIPFPTSGRQPRYRQDLGELLEQHGWQRAVCDSVGYSTYGGRMV